MQQGTANKSEMAARPALDQSKLFGFRNLVVVSKPGDDMRKSSDLAFNKRGTEDPDPR